MAYIDTSGMVSADASGSASVGVGAGPVGAAGPKGSGAPGTNHSLRGWTIAFYVIIAFFLVSTGLLFNKHATR